RVLKITPASMPFRGLRHGAAFRTSKPPAPAPLQCNESPLSRNSRCNIRSNNPPPAETLSPLNIVGEGSTTPLSFLKPAPVVFPAALSFCRAETSPLQNGTRHSKIGISRGGLSSVGR